jgi:hypothetical protein
MGLLERMANKVSQVHRASRAQLAHAVRLERPVPRVQLVQLALKASRAHKEFRASRAHKVRQDPLAQLEQWDRKVRLDLWVHKAHRGLLDRWAPKVKKARRDHQVSMVLMVLKDQLVQLVLRDRQVQPVHKDPQEDLGRMEVSMTQRQSKLQPVKPFAFR